MCECGRMITIFLKNKDPLEVPKNSSALSVASSLGILKKTLVLKLTES